MPTNSSTILNRIFQDTPAADLWHRTSPMVHVLFVLALAFIVHLVVTLIKRFSEWSINKTHAHKNSLVFAQQQPKFITITRLVVSSVTFVIYFLAIGFVLVQGFNLNLTHI